MKYIILLITVLTCSFVSLSQDFTIRGFVYEFETGEPAPFIRVRIQELNVGAITDLNGFFSIPKLPKGDYTIEVSNIQYETITQKVKAEATGFLDLRFEMKTGSVLKEVEVTAEERQKTTNVQTSVVKMDQKSIERIPSIGGESDVIAAFSVTPGVVTTGDQGGQMYVRGGTPIQNKILLDGMTIYNPFHSIGFFSVFETEVIKNVDIYTGGFSSKYGGRISSIMDVTYRDGNRKKLSGKFSASPFMGRVILEGPLIKSEEGKNNGATFIFSGKQSLLNSSSTVLYPYVNDGEGLPFTFTDLYGKMTFNAGSGAKVSFFGFGFNDRVKYDNIADLNWKSYGGGMNFSLVPGSSPVFIQGHLNASNYSLSLEENLLQPRNSSIFGFDMGFDFTYFLKKSSEFSYGINIGGFNTNFQTFNELGRPIGDENFTMEVGSYANYRFIAGRFVVEPGVRLQYYTTLSTLSPEPRIGVKFNATENFRLKASGGRYSQNFTSASSDRDVVNLFNGFLSAPTNIQSSFVNQNGVTMNNIRNGLQYAWHAVFGFEADLTRKWSLNVEGYFKDFTRLSNINMNKLYDDLSAFSQIDDVYKKDFIIESGSAYGVDFLLKYTAKNFYIWSVYSLGKVTRWDSFIEYAPVFDRRHNANFVFTYILGKKKDLEISLRWNYGSGLPFTPTAGFYQTEPMSGGVSTDYTATNPQSFETLLGEINSKRLPDYHRLDVTIKKQVTFKNKTTMEIVGGVTNLYNRQNIFYVNRATNEKIYQLPILPSVGLSYKF
jgi:hypothetical protein